MQIFSSNGNGSGRNLIDLETEVMQFLSRHGRMIKWLGGGLLPLLLLLTGVYSVGPGELGVVRTFGRESKKAGPGLHYRVPLVQEVDIINVEQIRRLEVGFRGKERISSESLMLTADENIVEAQIIVQYRVIDPSKFLFRIRAPEDALRATAEVALRGKVGQTTIDDVITTAREKVQDETRAWLQTLMDRYESGVAVTQVKLQVVDAPDEVKDAFHDVVRAREEKEKLINQAKGYRADRIPRARGEARKNEREAEGYKEQRVLRARGDAAKFESILAEYLKAVGVTRERLHLEMMERILGGIEKKVLIDKDVARGTMPVLQLGAALTGVQDEEKRK